MKGRRRHADEQARLERELDRLRRALADRDRQLAEAERRIADASVLPVVFVDRLRAGHPGWLR